MLGDLYSERPPPLELVRRRGGLVRPTDPIETSTRARARAHLAALALVVLSAASLASVLLDAGRAAAQESATPTGTVAGEVLLLLSNRTTSPGAEAVVWLPGAPTPPPPSRLELAQQDKR